MKNKQSRLINHFLVMAALCCASLSACATVPLAEVNSNAEAIFARAQEQARRGNREEAAALAFSLRGLHRSDPAIHELIGLLSAKERAVVFPNEWLGFNHARRVKVVPTTLEKALWYIPDRIGDLIDIFTVHFNYGLEIGAGVWVTRAAQVQAYVGALNGGGFFQKKQYMGFIAEATAEVGLGPFVATAIYGTRIGIGGLDTVSERLIFHKPSHPLYQTYRDYWGVGAKVGLCVFGFEFEIHPLEIADFFAGFLLYDPLNDDWATTRPLAFSSEEKNLVEKFQDQVRKLSTEEREKYGKTYPRLMSKPGKREGIKGDDMRINDGKGSGGGEKSKGPGGI